MDTLLPMESSMPLSSPDLQLLQIVGEQRPQSITDVISALQQIDALLPGDDGLKWFNRLYLTVTQQVDQRPPESGWRNPDWLLRLDVTFAQLYFDAVEACLNAKEVPSAWQALIEARRRPGIDRIQFALAGMNAHVNHDLALALLATEQQLTHMPNLESPEHDDYLAVNDLLNSANARDTLYACD